MRTMTGALIIVLGVLLLIYGLDASEALYSLFSNLFSGAPAEKSRWLLIGGVFAVVLGMAMAFTRGGHPKT